MKMIATSSSGFISWVLLLLLLLVSVPPVAPGNDAPSASSVLRSLARSLDPDKRLSDWWGAATSESPCKWTGVKCAVEGTTSDSPELITSLDLRSMNLSGSVSSDIGLLTGLTLLNLSDNSLTGELPAAITSLVNLTVLDIAVNLFSGSFPAGFSKLTKLRFLRAYNNNFTGRLPAELGEIPGLEILDLGGSYFEGSIPVSFTQLKSLTVLRLSGNAISGSIPDNIGNLSSLKFLQLSYNPALSGSIPDSIGQLTALEYLSLEKCNLSGSIPDTFANLTSCNTTFMFQNKLSGPIPASMGGMSALMSLDLSNNSLSGPIPDSFSKLKSLTLLNLMINNLSGELPPFIGELPDLQVLKIFTNSFTGSLPSSLGTARGLTWIDGSSNQLSGSIPDTICQGGSLVKLEFFSNRLTGPIPDLSSCTRLVRVRLHENQLSGAVPAEFGTMKELNKLELSDNLLSGVIPDSLADAPQLSSIDVSNNRLTGGIPPRLFAMPQLQELFLARNQLEGSIPRDIGNATRLQKLDLSRNLLSGDIPDEISGCTKLIAVDLSGNRLSGEIPAAIAELPVLATVDLSSNKLSGKIPQDLEKSDTLESFNVSDNLLSGPMPTMGIFRTENPSSFLGNRGLCGGILSDIQPCRGSDVISDSIAKSTSNKTLAWIIALVVAIGLGLLVLSWRCICRALGRMKQGRRDSPGDFQLPLGEWKLTAFQRLGYNSFDILECLKESNVIGKGAAGTVYRAQMRNGEVLAVKKLRNATGTEQEAHVQRAFLAEVNLLGGIRHRNIVRLLGFCSNGDSNLLIYEYMLNGSLAEALHGGKDSASSVLADWVGRYNVAVGIAQGLCYLHHDCFPQIVHRDVKSSNILLDADMEARVADFGVAKLVESSDQPMSVIAGSYGYIPPEYAYTMRVDERGDVYSYGVVLLELLTGKRPVEPEFGDNVNIVEWVRSRILQGNKGGSDNPSKVPVGVLDPSIVGPGSSVEEEMVLVLRVALLCTSKLPRERPSMRDVVTMLSEAKPRRKESCQPVVKD